MPSSLPRISEAEWEVMEILWEKSPLSAQEVVARLSQTHDWKDRTIRTMLGRLVKKGALHYREENNRFFYRPAIRRSDSVKSASSSFLQRLFGGAVQPLIVQLVKESKLSPEEISELKQILNQKQKGKE